MSKPIEESPNERWHGHNSVWQNCGDFRSSNPYSLWLSLGTPLKPLYGVVEALHNPISFLGIRENSAHENGFGNF